MWDARWCQYKKYTAGIIDRYILGQLQNSIKKKVVKEEWHRPGGEKVELVFLYTAITYILCLQCIHAFTHYEKTTSSTFQAPAFLYFISETSLHLDYFPCLDMIKLKYILQVKKKYD